MVITVERLANLSRERRGVPEMNLRLSTLGCFNLCGTKARGTGC